MVPNYGRESCEVGILVDFFFFLDVTTTLVVVSGTFPNPTDIYTIRKSERGLLLIFSARNSPIIYTSEDPARVRETTT